MNNNTCPCGSAQNYSDCCGKIHSGREAAQDAEALMRARYSAFALQNIDFIYNTFHPTTRRFQNKKEIATWAQACKWIHLEIIRSTVNTVEFKAHYLDEEGQPHIHHEKSTFKMLNKQWFYVDGKIFA